MFAFNFKGVTFSEIFVKKKKRFVEDQKVIFSIKILKKEIVKIYFLTNHQ
jgi:hypothetical protein